MNRALKHRRLGWGLVALSLLLPIFPLFADATSDKDDTWWSLSPIADVNPPTPKIQYTNWVHHPIDQFILDSLNQQKLIPAAPAKPAVLIRRVYYDLIGLPPSPETIAEFSSQCLSETGSPNQIGPNVYAELIDTLLASPQYGERWARHWLDIVHYGETHGFDKDQRRNNAWPYRDYVIRAFNDDKPYPEFISEQIAGDVIKPKDPSGVIATGFLASGPWDLVGQKEVREGTLEKKRVRNLDRDDIVTNVFTTFMSTTVQCARCHDHKFDPVSTQEYYNLQAIFAGIDRSEREYESVESALTRTTLSGDITYQQKAINTTSTAIHAQFSPEYRLRETTLNGLKKQRQTWTEEQKAKDKKSPSNGYHSVISLTNTEEHWVQVELDEPTALQTIHLLPARPTDFKDTPGFGFPIRYTVSISADATGNSFTTLADHSKTPFANPGNTPVIIEAGDQLIKRIRITAHELWERNNDFVFSLAELQAYSGEENLAYKSAVTASSSIDYGRWHTKNLVDGFDSRQRLGTQSEIPEDILALDVSIKSIQARLDALYIKDVSQEQRNQKETQTNELVRLQGELAQLPKPKKVYAIKTVPARPIHVLIRGSEKAPGNVAYPAALECLPEMNQNNIQFPKDDTDKARATLAYWLSHPDNNLTWRSIVNRVWQYHFGRGIVDTPNDFGQAGSRPTHPELLDWLANRFKQNPSMKNLHRLILTSQTYQQSSAHNTHNAAIDASNQYLWRMNRRKLDAESVRDSILSISQKLDLAMGGPSFDLFNYTHDHSPRYDYMGKDTPEVWRRSVYRFVVRSVPDPLFEALDCADPNLNTPVRNQTLTAPQALAMLNDIFIVDQAKHTASYLAAQTHDVDKQIQRLHHYALGRSTTPDELVLLSDFNAEHGLENTTRLIFNLNEFMFVD